MGGACSMNRKNRNAYKLLVGKPEGKRPLERSSCKWVDYIKMDLREVKWGGVDWIYMSRNTKNWGDLVNLVLNLRVSIQCWETIEWLSPIELVIYYYYCYYLQ
jgi:hypothetical protein